jgi:hypothetical protein
LIGGRLLQKLRKRVDGTQRFPEIVHHPINEIRPFRGSLIVASWGEAFAGIQAILRRKRKRVWR